MRRVAYRAVSRTQRRSPSVASARRQSGRPGTYRASAARQHAPRDSQSARGSHTARGFASGARTDSALSKSFSASISIDPRFNPTSSLGITSSSFDITSTG